MSSSIGSKFRVSIFGESHGKMIGTVIEGIPAGFEIDFDEVKSFLQKRKGGKDFTTKRNEKDKFDVVSGYFDGRATGTPFTALIRNSDLKSKDYEYMRYVFRPSHADYTGYIKYSAFNDYRGGGHFSGRLTAPLCIAGAIAMQILKKNYGVEIFSHILNIGNVCDDSICDASYEEKKKIFEKELAFINDKKLRLAAKQIQSVQEQGDSIGGIVETEICGLRAGIGEPIFDTLEGNISKAVFAVPAVKGVDFGAGFVAGHMKGSEYNDSLRLVNDDLEKSGKIITVTNHDGGVNGGISNGMPIVFCTAIKPTPSIFISQETVDISKNENTNLQIKGRHDPAIAVRAVPAVMSATAISLLDLIMEA